MKRALFLFLLLPYIATVEAGMWDQFKNIFGCSEKPQPPQIKVLVAFDTDAAMVEVKGRYSVKDPFTGDNLGTRFSARSALIQALPDGIKWNEHFVDSHQIEIIPENDEGLVYVDGIPYQGSIMIYDVQGGSVGIVNKVDIETYLHSVIAQQLDEEHSDEALASFAIAVRTQAYYQAMAATNPYWHVDANQSHYRGKSFDDKERVHRAIDVTRYMVLSQTGTYEGMLTPFPVLVSFSEEAETTKKHRAFTIKEADKLAAQGYNAARILAKCFPNVSVELSFDNKPNSSNTQVAERATHSGPMRKRSFH